MAFCAPPDLGVPACFFVRLASLVCLSQRTGLSRAEVQGLACMPPKDVSKSLASNTHTHTQKWSFGASPKKQLSSTCHRQVPGLLQGQRAQVKVFGGTWVFKPSHLVGCKPWPEEDYPQLPQKAIKNTYKYPRIQLQEFPQDLQRSESWAWTQNAAKDEPLEASW